MHRPTYFLGLDLGQAADFSALAVLERTTGPDPAARGRTASLYAVPYLRRWELGTPYPAIVADLKGLLGRATAADPSYRPLRDAVVGVDQTGVGRAVGAVSV